MNHLFQLMANMKFNQLMSKKYPPPFVPNNETLNCDPTYELEEMIVEVARKFISIFYMPGAADGISSRQYSPRSPFLYPNLSPIDFLSPCFVVLPNFELCKVMLGFLRVPLGSSVFLKVPQGSLESLFLKVPLGSLGFSRVLRII